MSKKQWLQTGFFITLSFALWSLFLLLPGVVAKLSQEQGYGLSVDRAVPAMLLSNAKGEPMAIDDFAGRFVYFYIGYLNCNGVCQTHLSTLFQLDRNASPTLDFDIVFMTMDPERDTHEILSSRINSLGARFHAALPIDFSSGQAIAREFNVPYIKQPSRVNDYSIDHAAFIFLIDPHGRWIRTYTGRFLNADLMLSELQHLAQGYSNEPI